MDLTPSTYVSSPWIRVDGKRPRRINVRKIGKWLLFFPEEEIDAHWERIAQATSEGRLGISAKVSTAWGHHHPSPHDPTRRVICVYTRSHTDLPDVRMVREELRKMGYEGPLQYKTDEATLRGEEVYLIDEILSVDRY